MQNCRQRWLSDNEKLTASGGFAPAPAVFGVALPLTSSKGSALWPHWDRPQIHNPPFQNPGSTGVQQELFTQ